MQSVKGFDTLKVQEINGKFYIFAVVYKRTIGPVFDSIKELEDYADKKFTGVYC